MYNQRVRTRHYKEPKGAYHESREFFLIEFFPLHKIEMTFDVEAICSPVFDLEEHFLND
jgi:hypothetical protein